jgi:AraC-like DNA-binding protein
MIPHINGLLAQRGADGAALIRAAGLPNEALRGEITAPLGRIEKFLELAADALECELGLDLATKNAPGVYGIPELLVRSAPEIRLALRALTDAAALVNPVLLFHFEEDGEEGVFRFEILGRRDTLGRQLNEYTVAYVQRTFAAILDGGFPLRRAWFSHGRTRNVDEPAQRLGCDVRYQAHDCGFAVSPGILGLAPRTAEAPLFNFLREQARAQLATLASDDFVSQVVHVIEVRLAHGDVGLAAVASAMATTARSLQRHLGDAGTTYRDVLAYVRRRRHDQLRKAGLREVDIATRLGFSDVQAMKRSLADDDE